MVVDAAAEPLLHLGPFGGLLLGQQREVALVGKAETAVDVHADNVCRVGDRDLRGDVRAEVAALSAVTLVAEPAHELRPHPGHAGDVEPFLSRRVAYDNDRQEWRTFRVDRMLRPHATGARFAPRDLPTADAAAYVAGRRTDWWTPTFRVRVTLHLPARDVAGRLGEAPGDLRPLAERRCLLDGMRDDSLEWLAHRIVQLGCEFEVHDPPELATYLCELAERLLRAARPSEARGRVAP